MTGAAAQTDLLQTLQFLDPLFMSVISLSSASHELGASLWFCQEDWLSLPSPEFWAVAPPLCRVISVCHLVLETAEVSAPATPLPCHFLCCYVSIPFVILVESQKERETVTFAQTRVLNL